MTFTKGQRLDLVDDDSIGVRQYKEASLLQFVSEQRFISHKV